jgi:hypothetical protein
MTKNKSNKQDGNSFFDKFLWPLLITVLAGVLLLLIQSRMYALPPAILTVIGIPTQTMAPLETKIPTLGSTFTPSMTSTSTSTQLSPTVLPSTTAPPPSSTSSIVLTEDLETSVIVDFSCGDAYGPFRPRILPGFIMPFQDQEKAFRQIKASVNNSEWFDWFQAPYDNGALWVLVDISNVTDGKKWMRVNKTVTVSVKSNLQELPEIVDIYWREKPCGGGGEIFDTFDMENITLRSDIDAYEVYSSSTEYDNFSLEPGEYGIFGFGLVCATPGLYSVEFGFGFNIGDGIDKLTLTDAVIIMCPIAYREWSSDLFLTSLQSLGTFVWEGEKYEKQ